MPFKRTDRVNSLIRDELQQLIQREVKDPRVGFATVTAVETSADLRHAKVHVSVMADDAEAETAVRALQKARAYFRHELASRLDMHHVPELDFARDASLERAMRIDRLLKEARERDRH